MVGDYEHLQFLREDHVQIPSLFNSQHMGLTFTNTVQQYITQVTVNFINIISTKLANSQLIYSTISLIWVLAL